MFFFPFYTVPRPNTQLQNYFIRFSTLSVFLRVSVFLF